MANRQSRNPLFAPLLAALVVMLATLACGGLGTKQAESPKPVASSAPATAPPSATVSPPPAVATATPRPAAPVATPAPVSPTRNSVGDIVHAGSLAFVVLGWDSPPGDRYNKPEEGQKFVAVDVLFVNQGNDSTSVSSLLQTNLRDSEGQEFQYDPVASIAAGAGNPDGEIGPGEQVRGTIGFQVPQDAGGLVFVFHDMVFGTGSASVELGAEPAAVPVPQGLIAETGQATLAVGDSIEIAGLTLTIDDIHAAPEFRSNKPDAGKQFMILDTTIENQGSEPVGMSSVLKLYLLQMYLKDSTGQKHDLDLLASIGTAKDTPGSEIASGQKIGGQVAFQVPADVQGLVLVLDTGALGQGRILIALPD